MRRKRYAPGRRHWQVAGGILLLLILLTGGLIYGLRSGKKPSAEYSPEQYKVAQDKLQGITESENEQEKSKTLDVILTDKDVMALLNEAARKENAVQNITVSLHDENRMDAAFTVSDHLSEYLEKQKITDAGWAVGMLEGASVSLSGRLHLVDSKTVELELEKMKVGLLPVPSGIRDQMEEMVNRMVSNALAGKQGTELQELILSENQLQLKGIIQNP